MSKIQDESKLSTSIRHLMESKGAWGFKVFGNAYQMAGIPDLLFCENGRFVAIESKVVSPTEAKGNLTVIQRKRCKDIRAANGIAFVARTIDDAQAFIDKDYRIIDFEIMYDKKDESYIAHGICSMGQYTSWIARFKKNLDI